MCYIDYVHHDYHMFMSVEDHLGLLLSDALFVDQRPCLHRESLCLDLVALFLLMLLLLVVSSSSHVCCWCSFFSRPPCFASLS